MKARRWLEFNYIVNSFKNYFWNFHYILLYGLLTMVLSLGILTAGPALIALCSSMRLISDDRKATFAYYFGEFRRCFALGSIFSCIVVTGGISVWLSLNIITQELRTYTVFSYIAITMVLLVLYMLFYFPFAAFSEEKFIQAAKKSISYSIAYFWDTLIHICGLYILYRIMTISTVVVVSLFASTSAFIINRFIHANNKTVDENQQPT